MESKFDNIILKLSSKNRLKFHFLLSFFFLVFETGFLCIALAVLELTLFLVTLDVTISFLRLHV